eukprot:5451632-Ditylum_brightwellii.AAC.1
MSDTLQHDQKLKYQSYVLLWGVHCAIRGKTCKGSLPKLLRTTLKKELDKARVAYEVFLQQWKRYNNEGGHPGEAILEEVEVMINTIGAHYDHLEDQVDVNKDQLMKKQGTMRALANADKCI